MIKAEQHPQSTFRPALVTQIELSETLPNIETDQSTSYSVAMTLVRIHGEPLGIIELELDNGRIGPEDYAPLVWAEFSASLNQHLEADGLPRVDALPAAGLNAARPGSSCEKAREQALAKAPMASVVIATRERAEQLARCLESFRDVIYPRYEVLIIDNAPQTSSTADLVQHMKAYLTNLRYIREDRKGVSVAHNRGIEEARGEMIVFLDDDVVVDPYWLIELARGFEAEENVGCVTSLVIPMELETEAQLLFERYDGFNRGYERRIFDMGKHRMKNIYYPYSVGHCGTGASMAFTREAIRAIGGQDPALGPGTPTFAGDDMDTFFLMITHGYQLVYNPTSIALHQHRRSYEELRDQVYNYGVGLTAYLTKCLFSDLRRALGLLTRIPPGLYNLLASRSSRNTTRGRDFPADLARIEWAGMLYGPIAYLRAIAALRNDKQPVLKTSAETIKRPY